MHERRNASMKTWVKKVNYHINSIKASVLIITPPLRNHAETNFYELALIELIR